MSDRPDPIETGKALQKLQAVGEVLQAQSGDMFDLSVNALKGLGWLVEEITADLRELCGVPAD